MGKTLTCQAGTLLLLVLAALQASSEETLTYSVRVNDHSLDAVCVGVTAGIFPHPDPSLCDVFVSCTFEQPTANQCADGFIFDPIVQRCVQGDREQCADRTPEPDWSVFCADVSYAFYEHPNMCWEFVFCSLGTANRYSCPLGEIWSQRDGACLPGSWDSCELVIVEASCEGQPDGVLPYSPDCSRYMRCTGGHTNIIDCPRGEVFEEQVGQCVVGNTESCMRLDNICQGELDGTVLVHPNECDLFVLCQGGSATAHQCPTDEILNVQAQFCAPGNADTCQFHPQETMCRNATNGAIYPLPGDCTQFVLCSAGESITMNCPTGQILYAPSGSCRPGNTNTCELLGSVCQDQPDGSMIAHPSLCEIYILCQGGSAMIRSCPSQEILRPDVQFCVPGNLRTCEYEPLDRMCVGQMDAVSFPHPTDCAMFVVCQNQRAQVQTCLAGSVYNAQRRTCVPGNEATCEEFNSICSGRPDGIIPHPTKCTAYVYCSAGRPVFEQCSPGTIYKQGLSGCVVGDTEACTHATNICTDHPDGTLLEHPNECNLIVMCMAHQPGVMFCPVGEIFNMKVEFCTPGDTKTCQMHPVETMCANMPHGSVYPHPSDCTQYVRCNGGQPIVTSCPVGHVLHAGSGSCRPGNTNTCEFIENVCKNKHDGLVLKHPSHCGQFIWCQGGTVSVQPCPVDEILRPDAQFCVPGDSNTCEFDPVDRMCIRKSDYSRFPHPTDCSLFVACQGQNALVQSCPSGSVYHAATRSCVPGNEVTCERFDNICSGNVDKIIPHPLVCTAYIHCFSNMAVFEQCALGTVFDRELGGCIVGNTKTCVSVGDLCEGQPDGKLVAHPNECELYLIPITMPSG
uniref:Chitin-binding type-2 domain-containing protein n=1 Tax=Anopheles maculatus TaxID=74869 RepID=A0A182SK29_9DIPT